jgi:uncharacterized cupin superfamily protein
MAPLASGILSPSQETAMSSQERPSFIVHWSEIQKPDDSHYPGDDERMGIGSPFGLHFGLTKLGIHHVRLLPGRRTSYPHAESEEEEFVYVIEGEPEVWLDGHLHKLKPGDAVGFPAVTGINHTVINNTEAEVRLLVVGERSRPENRVFYPLHPHRRTQIDDWWDTPPERALGPHDGMPDRLRAAKARPSV